MTDDEERWERMLRAADPARTPADAPLTLAQHALRDRITAGTTRAPARAPRRGVWIGITTPLVALATLMIVLVLVVPFGAAPAAAYGPRPLEYQEISLSTDEAIDHAIAQLTAGPSEGEAERRSHVTSWSLSYSPDAVPEKQLVIEPFVRDVAWQEDLSGSIRLTAGSPFYADGPGGEIPTEAEYAAGELIGEDEYAPGEFPAAFPVLSPDGIGATLTDAGLDFTGAFAGDIVVEITDINQQWTLTNEQHAEVLSLMSDLGGASILGETRDRLGRDVIGIASTVSYDEHTRIVTLLSPATGRIIGVEQVALGTNEHLPVPEGTVLSYTLWDDVGEASPADSPHADPAATQIVPERHLAMSFGARIL